MIKYFIPLFLLLLAGCKEKQEGIHIVLKNNTKLELSDSDFKGIDCKKQLKNLEFDRLARPTEDKFLQISLNSYENDTLDFNLEFFRIVSGRSFRTGNFGGRRIKYSLKELKETICRFGNK